MDGVYSVRQVDETCWGIMENGVRCFLVTGSRRALLIDTGFGTGDLMALVGGMTGLPVMLVNTHADRDHIGGNKQFGPAHMHPAEYDRYHQGAGAGAPTAPLWEGDVIDLGGRALEIILIPGHTPGSIALLDRENRILFSGDSVQDGSIYMFGEGRNLPAYIDSMTKLQAMETLFDKVYPSHGSLPVEPGLTGALLESGKKLWRGELAASKPKRDIPAMEYDAGVASFLY